MDQNLATSLGFLVVFLVVAVILFLILREFFCWYWKINKIVHLLERIASKLAPEVLQEAAASPFDAGKAAHIRNDYVTAFRHWKPLADQGDARTQNNVGIMYEEGQGVPKDPVEALKWFTLSADKSDPGDQRDRAVRNRERVGKKLTADQIAEAQRRVRDWKPSSVST